MNAIALAFGPSFPEGVKRYRRKLIIDLQFFLKFRAASALAATIPSRTVEGEQLFAALQSAGIQGMVDCAYRLASLPDETLRSIRGDCAQDAPDLLPVIDGLLWLAREEKAEPKLATFAMSPHAALLTRFIDTTRTFPESKVIGTSRN